MKTKILGGILAAFWLLLPASALAVTTISRGYTSADPLPIGSIVSLENNASDKIVPSTAGNGDNILGVAISDANALLAISNGKEKQVQVATSGTVQVLVSDINGKISQGDQITASPVKGVGMKATTNAKVVGIAQGEMSAVGSGQQKYKDSEGKEKTMTLGEVPVLISVSYFFKTPEKTLIPSAIQNVANALAGKEVSTLPIIISLIIFIVTLIVVSSIIYSMIRSSIISVGRNPMSQSAVYRDVIQISALVLAILTGSIVAIYLVLTKL